MKKDIEWLKEKVQKRINKLPRAYSGLYIDGSRDAYRLALKDISQLDEPGALSQELPVIPVFVADLLEDYNDASMHSFLSDAFRNYREGRAGRADTWIAKNPADFVDAYRYGHTVEEEQKYNVKFKVKSSFGTVGIFLYKEGDEVLAGDNFKAYYPEKAECRLTEQEIREFQNGDVLFEHFAVKVEELEE